MRRSQNHAPAQIRTDTSEPAAVASPIGKSVEGYQTEAR